MDGTVIEHSDSDSGDSWTMLENSAYADDAADFSEILLERSVAEKQEKDEDTDGISVISDSEPDSHSPFQINYETVSDSNRPPEHDTAQYISVNPHLSNLQTDTKSVRDDDLLGDNKQKNKTYVHRRNKRLSTVLNIVVMASVITAAGVAIGHMWGAKTDCTLHNTPGVNKILSNLYRLQEENAYLREKLKEITVLTNYQVNYHKAQIKQNKCKKVFEESLHNNNNKPTTPCVDDRYDNVKLPQNHLQQSYEKDFGSNIDKLEDTYQENRSWIDESIKRLKLEDKPQEKISNPSKSNLARPKQSQKLKYSTNVIPEIEENSNDNIAEMADVIQKTLRFSKLLKSSIEDDTANKKNNNMDNVEKELYNKKQKIGNEINKRQDNKIKRLDKKFNKRNSDKVFEANVDATKTVNSNEEFDLDKYFSFEIQGRIDKKFNKRDRDRILDTQIDADIEFFKENDINEYGKSTKTDAQVEFDSNTEFFNDCDIKEDKRDKPDNLFDNNGKIITQKENKNGKTNDNDTKDKKFFKKGDTMVFALKEEIDKSKLIERFEKETDSFIGDNQKDNRYMGHKPKQNRKKYDHPKSNKKDKRRNKYEQWEMKGGLLKDYDDISFASSQDSGFLIEDNFKGEVDNDFVFVPNDSDKCSEEQDDDDDKTGCYIKQNRKDRNLHCLDKHTISCKEARRQLEKELFDGNVNTAGWYFRRMRKREQCRAKGDNSTYRKFSKRFKNFKTKQ